MRGMPRCARKSAQSVAARQAMSDSFVQLRQLPHAQDGDTWIALRLHRPLHSSESCRRKVSGVTYSNAAKILPRPVRRPVVYFFLSLSVFRINGDRYRTIPLRPSECPAGDRSFRPSRRFHGSPLSLPETAENRRERRLRQHASR